MGVGSRFNRTINKTAFARRLRCDSTDVEKRLWQKLRNRQLGADFRRQHPAGPFVLDFYCPSLRLAIELDGGQHAEAGHQTRDRQRQHWLGERAVTVLRFWNSDVAQNLNGVLEVIAAKVGELQATKMTPTRRWRADLPLSGGGGACGSLGAPMSITCPLRPSRSSARHRQGHRPTSR
ncbi:MAG TPA: endonuclease domain-containing protein [Xanthobacteraceae bacterium]|nr:endonuclease domain-containing protein [Xanthobacteraceae bacterium]